VTTTNSGTDTLNVTVAVTGAGNTLQAIRFGAARNATIDVTGGSTGSVGNVNQAYPAGTTQAAFVVHRQGGGAMTAPFTVVDGCGDWPTFVGGGTAVGQPAPAPTAIPTATPVPTGYPASGSRVYALGSYNPVVMVIDAATDNVLQQIQYFEGPISITPKLWPPDGIGANTAPVMVIHPNGHEIYVAFRANTSDGTPTVVAIDTALNRGVRRLSLPGAQCTSPFSIQISPDGAHLVLTCNPFVVVDTATLANVYTVPDGGTNYNYRDLTVFDPTSRYLYVTRFNNIIKIDLTTRQIVATSPGGVTGLLLLDTSRNRLYVSNGVVLDATTLAQIPVGPSGLMQAGGNQFGLSADGTRAIGGSSGGFYPSLCCGSVDIADTSTGNQTGQFVLDGNNGGTYAESVAMHPTRLRGYIGVRHYGNVTAQRMYDLVTNAFNTTPEARPEILGFSPDGAKVFITVSTGGIDVWDETLANLLVHHATADHNGNVVTPSSAAARIQTNRLYVAMRSYGATGGIAVGGVAVLDSQSGQQLDFIQQFDMRDVVVQP
jgi:hypothetical protein